MASDELGPKISGASFRQEPDHLGEIADETASVIELSGAIKWFDVSKGFGFITPTEGGFTIAAEGQHASELQALFQQHQMESRVEPGAGAGMDALVFSQEADMGHAQEILTMTRMQLGERYAFRQPAGVPPELRIDR